MLKAQRVDREVLRMSRKAKLLAGMAVLLPILSLLAGAALAAHQYGVL